jgi:hypothetical protein
MGIEKYLVFYIKVNNLNKNLIDHIHQMEIEKYNLKMILFIVILNKQAIKMIQKIFKIVIKNLKSG